MQNTIATAKRAARPLLLPAQLLFLGLAALGCVPPQPAPPAPPQQVQPAPQTGVSFLGTLTGKNGEQLTAHDIRNTPPFSTAYRALLRRNKLKEGWLTHFNAPGTLVRRVGIGGAEYLRVEGCKPGSCGAHSIVVLYCEKERAIYALLKQGSENIWLGEPSDEIKQAFAKLAGAEAPK